MISINTIWKLLFAVLLMLPVTLSAQNKYTISGYIKDGTNGEALLGANVYEVGNLTNATVTNIYGFYSLKIPEGQHNIAFSFLGFETVIDTIYLSQDVNITVELFPKQFMTKTVVITDDRKDENVEGTEMGKVELSTETIKSIPALMGEVDILRTIQLLPGIQSAGEGNSGFYVRGGGPDQNLILLDDAVVYNTGHLFGFFSIFNSDAIKNTTIYKGAMPAQYGGRLSSVLDISMKEGNMKKYEAEGGIGLISSRLTLQGPIEKDKASFIVSGRRTYIDVLTKPLLKNSDFSGNSYFFYDLNAKVNYIFSEKDRLYASGYFGRDIFNFASADTDFKFKFPWGNKTGTIRWNHLFTDQLFMNVTGVYNEFDFGAESQFTGVTFKLDSRVKDVGAKLDFDFYPSVQHTLKFGASYLFHNFRPYQATGTSGSTEFNATPQEKLGHEAGIYISDDWSISEFVKVNMGLRYSYFNHVGELSKIAFDPDNGQATDTTYYAKGESVAAYGGFEPRISARFKVNSSSSVKAGFSKTNQYIHLVSSSTSTLPTDLWVPSTNLVKPQVGYQYSVGYFKNFKENKYETSIEVYYKDLQNQIEFKENDLPQLNTDIEDFFTFGKGNSYGAELFLKKAKGDFNGWVGYTLSQTNRYFDDINEGNRFPAKYDRRHDLSLVLLYEINDKWNVGGTFVYGTGQTTTIPERAYVISGTPTFDYGSRNGFRLRPYHRADVSATCKLGKKDRSQLVMSVYNLYNRKNPYFLFVDQTGEITNNDLEFKMKQVSLFPIIPSITWNFKY